MTEYNNKIYLYEDKIGYVEYIQHTGDDLTIVNAARVSTGKESLSFEEKDRKLLDFLIRSGHTSTLEHNILTVRCKVPIFISKQHMRHRTQSYNEISRRYTAEQIEFYIPDSLRPQDKKNRQATLMEDYNPLLESTGFDAINSLKQHCENSKKVYDEMIQKGIGREMARMYLPQNLYTTYWATANLNNWMDFISKRSHDDAQYEIRQLAGGVEKIVKDLWPFAHESYLNNKKL
jgi:thymidylate synthase (FAD)